MSVDFEDDYFNITVDKENYLQLFCFSKNKYISISISFIYTLKSSYTISLYHALKAGVDINNEAIYDIALLRILLGTKNFYPTCNRFNTLLKRSIKEINDSGLMKIAIKEKVKKGRNVKSIIFTVIDNEFLTHELAAEQSV